MACVTIRTTEVIADLNVQKVAETTVAAPTGLTVNPTTGTLNLTPTFSPASDPVLNATVLADKVVNYGFVLGTLVVPLPVPVSIYLALQIQAVTDVPGALPGDTTEEYPELEGVVIYGVPTIDPVTGTQTGTTIVVKAVYSVRLVVLRAGTLSVQTCDNSAAVAPMGPKS